MIGNYLTLYWRYINKSGSADLAARSRHKSTTEAVLPNGTERLA